jgi:hypothetical protein
MPSSPATRSATSGLSPVTSAVCSIPASRKLGTSRAASSRRRSSSRMTAAGAPSIATYTLAAPPSTGCPTVRPCAWSQRALPTSTRCPSTTPSMPWPSVSSALSGSESSSPRCSAPGHERGRERMRREPVERSSEPQHLAFWQAVQGGDVGELRVAERDRTGLVEQHRARLAQPLDRPGALDHRTSAA